MRQFYGLVLFLSTMELFAASEFTSYVVENSLCDGHFEEGTKTVPQPSEASIDFVLKKRVGKLFTETSRFGGEAVLDSSTKRYIESDHLTADSRMDSIGKQSVIDIFAHSQNPFVGVVRKNLGKFSGFHTDEGLKPFTYKVGFLNGGNMRVDNAFEISSLDIARFPLSELPAAIPIEGLSCPCDLTVRRFILHGNPRENIQRSFGLVDILFVNGQKEDSGKSFSYALAADLGIGQRLGSRHFELSLNKRGYLEEHYKALFDRVRYFEGGIAEADYQNFLVAQTWRPGIDRFQHYGHHEQNYPFLSGRIFDYAEIKEANAELNLSFNPAPSTNTLQLEKNALKLVQGIVDGTVKVSARDVYRRLQLDALRALLKDYSEINYICVPLDRMTLVGMPYTEGSIVDRFGDPRTDGAIRQSSSVYIMGTNVTGEQRLLALAEVQNEVFEVEDFAKTAPDGTNEKWVVEVDKLFSLYVQP